MASVKQLVCPMCNHVMHEAMIGMPEPEDTEENVDELLEIADATNNPEAHPCPKCHFVSKEAYIIDPYDNEDEDEEDEKPDLWNRSGE